MPSPGDGAYMAQNGVYRVSHSEASGRSEMWRKIAELRSLVKRGASSCGIFWTLLPCQEIAHELFLGKPSNKDPRILESVNPQTWTKTISSSNILSYLHFIQRSFFLQGILITRVCRTVRCTRLIDVALGQGIFRVSPPAIRDLLTGHTAIIGTDSIDDNATYAGCYQTYNSRYILHKHPANAWL